MLVDDNQSIINRYLRREAVCVYVGVRDDVRLAGASQRTREDCALGHEAIRMHGHRLQESVLAEEVRQFIDFIDF